MSIVIVRHVFWVESGIIPFPKNKITKCIENNFLTGLILLPLVGMFISLLTPEVVMSTLTAPIDNHDKSESIHFYNLDRSLKGHEDTVMSVVLSDKLVISGALDSRVKVWDLSKVKGDEFQYDLVKKTMIAVE
jgi:hypothetical protein